MITTRRTYSCLSSDPFMTLNEYVNFHFFRETILKELDRNRPLVDRLLSDITYQSADNLVDGLTKIEEEGYTYEHYYGNKKYQTFGQDFK